MSVVVVMVVVVKMVRPFDIKSPRHHENMPVGPEHLNIRTEKLR